MFAGTVFTEEYSGSTVGRLQVQSVLFVV